MKQQKQVRFGFALNIALCGVLFSILPADAITFTVNSTADAVDANPGDGVCDATPPTGACTLRAAIMEANHLASGPHTINLPAGTYTLTIPKATPDNEVKGDLDITASMDIVGAGSSSTIIDGNGDITNDGVIEITNTTVNIFDVTIRNGTSGILNFGGDLTLTNSTVSDNNGAGGGIFSQGGGAKLTLINSTVSGNSSLGGAGGINHGGGLGLIITNSTVSGNSTTGCCGLLNAGGILLRLGTLTMINSTVSNNRVSIGLSGVSSLSGGIQIDTTTQSNIIMDSTIDGNRVTGNDGFAGTGGGILLTSGRVTIINTTVSGNSANTSGGGIHNTSTTGALDIFNSTITGNTAGTNEKEGGSVGSGGGVFTGAMSTTTFQNTILAGNRAFILTFPNKTVTLQFNDCAGTINSDGHNLMGVQSCTVTGVAPIVADPQLGVLKFNGGPTKTHALLNASPAIDTGDCELGPKVRTDQRGFLRTVDGDHNGSFNCDIGSYEFGAGSPGPVDLDRDGEGDVAVYQPNTGHWFFVRSAVGFGQQLNFGGANFLPVPADYDGDGAADTAVYDTTNGNWFIDQSTDPFKIQPSFGGPGFIPVPGDYDGDGKHDVGVYETSTGNWFVVQSGGGFRTVASFGGPGFIPVPADYDGDGRTDPAVYETSTGNWFINQSAAGFRINPSFGGAGFIPYPGDYDGDGETDVAVYQSSTGHWFFVGSTSGFGNHLSFGGPGYYPVSADFDGDGQMDTSVYDTTNGNWFIDQSTAGFGVHPSFGGTGFVPVLPQVTILRALGVL